MKELKKEIERFVAACNRFGDILEEEVKATKALATDVKGLRGLGKGEE